MKRYLTFIIAGLSFSAVEAQGLTDAVRYAQDNQTGTARFMAMSGAFGALGGDLSSINVNPAGGAIFANSQVGFSLSSYNVNNDSNYFGTKTNEYNNAFDISQGGLVFVFSNASKGGWNTFSLGVNYENTNNFDNSMFSAGTNPNNSIADYFLSYANPNATQGGIPLSTLQNSNYPDLNYQDQQAFLGYQGYLINAVDPTNQNNDTYVSNVPAGGNYYQEHSFESTGYNGKLSINASTQYKDKLYLGINLNSHFTDYRQLTNFYEDNSNSQTAGVQSLRFNNDLYTYGTGFSLQLGAIAKVTKELRMGLAYESPTWYQLNDELRQTLTSSGYNFGNPPNPGFTNTTVNSDFTIVYQPYNLRTPGKWTGSMAYVFGKQGLISVDYSLKNYGNTRYTPTNDINNTGINKDLRDALTNTGEIRVGGEYRIKEWRLRAGFRNEQSPYKNKQTMGDLTGFSGGFGYNFGFTKLDFAYAHSQRNSQEAFFSQGFTDAPQVKTMNNNFTATLLFEL